MKLEKVNFSCNHELYILSDSCLKSENIEILPPYRNGVVLKGRDIVEYHNIKTKNINNCLVPISKNRNILKEKLSGKKENKLVLLNQGGLYTFYFKNKKNKKLFINCPTKYLPAVGGFCLWGLAYEWHNEGECQNAPQCNDLGLEWPWTKYIMGPPADTELGWFLYKGKIYFNFSSNYRDEAIKDINFSVELANKRWIKYYNNDIGPLNVRSWGEPDPQYERSVKLSKTEELKLLPELNFITEAIEYSKDQS